MDELPAILVKRDGHCTLTALQTAHLEFLYTRTATTKSDICAMVNIEMSTLDRLIRRAGWPLRQPHHWTQHGKS